MFPPGWLNPGEIAFHIRHENRNAARAEIFRERLQRDGFAGAGRAGDQAMAVRHFRQEIDRLLCLGDENRVVHRHNTAFELTLQFIELFRPLLLQPKRLPAVDSGSRVLVDQIGAASIDTSMAQAQTSDCRMVGR